MVAAFGSASVAVTGCGNGIESVDETTYYGSAGAVQCGPNPFTASSVSALAAKLNSDGVYVGAISCGNDGLAHSTSCGTATGDIWLVLAVNSKRELMRSLGFAPAAELPSIREVPCG